MLKTQSFIFHLGIGTIFSELGFYIFTLNNDKDLKKLSVFGSTIKVVMSRTGREVKFLRTHLINTHQSTLHFKFVKKYIKLNCDLRLGQFFRA